ncbi:unnamed protein product [Rhizophagus irregularis]|nr:unnamed protein product [Rhizophagus irregularis]
MKCVIGQHWEVLAQNTQIQLANIQAQFANSQIQLVNVQRERDESRRNAHRLLLRYNTETERSRRRANGSIQQARAWRGQFLNCRNHGQNLQNQVNNLNQQILALQNNPPVIQQPIMAGYAPKKFRGTSGEDPNFGFKNLGNGVSLLDLILLLMLELVLGFMGSLKLYLKMMLEIGMKHISKEKNWECVNLLDNIGAATFHAVNAMNNGAIAAVAVNQFVGRALVRRGQAPADNTITGATFIPSHTVWDEDCSWDTYWNKYYIVLGITSLLITSEKSKITFQAIVQVGGTTYWFGNSVASILHKLEDIERYRTDIAPTSIVAYQGPTLADIENLINSKIPVTTAKPSARLLALAYKLGLPRDVDISKVTLSDLEIFIDTELNKNLPSDHIYRGNQVFGISSGIRKLKKPKKCSSCGKSGHTKSSCPKSKKGKRKTNYAHDSSDPSDSSDSSNSSDSSDSDSDSGHACYGIKKKPTERKRVDKKTTDKKKSQLERQRIIFEVFIQLLKLLVQSFVNAVQKRLLYLLTML